MSARPDFLSSSASAPSPDLDLLRLALEQQPDDFAILKPDCSVEWLAPRFAARLGVDAAEAIGRPWFELQPLAASRAVAYECALGGEAMDLQARPQIRDGTVRYFATRLQPLIANHRVRALLVVERDITDKFVEPELESRRTAIVRAMSEGSSDIVTLLDASAKVLFVSDSLTGVLGHLPAQLVGTNIFGIVHDEDLLEARQRFANGSVLLAPLRVLRYRGRFRHADGSWRSIESLVVNALLDPLVAAFIVYSRDITEDLALEQRLARRERRFAMLTRRSGELIAVLSPQLQLTFEGSSSGNLLGYEPQELGGRGLLRLIPAGQRRLVLGALRTLLNHREREQQLTFMLHARDGSGRWMEAFATDLCDDADVGGILINARDVTERKMIEDEFACALDGGEVALWDQDLTTRRLRWLNAGGPQQLFGDMTTPDGEARWIGNIHPDDHAQVMQAYAALESGRCDHAHVEYRLRIADGSHRWIIERARMGSSGAGAGSRKITGITIDVTDRHRAEEELANTRELFRIALDCAQIGFYDRDIGRDVIRGLESWFVSVGLPQETGRTGHLERWLQRMHPDDRAPTCAVFDAHVRGETEFAEAEYRLRSSDNTRWVWTLDRAKVTERDADGRALRLAGVVMDIDRRKRLELAFGATESRLATAIWGANFGLWELDVGTQHATWFSDWCRVEDIEACAGADHVASWDANIHPDDLPAAEALFSRMLAGEVDAYEAEYRVRTLSGEWRWIFERSRAVLHDGDGKPQRVVGICMNIDARKRAEEALKRSEFRYRSVAELTPGYVAEYAFDAQGIPQLAWASDGFQQVFGVSIEEFKSGPWDANYRDEEQRAVGLQHAAALRRGERTQGEFEILHRDGSPRWLQVATAPLRDPQTGRISAALGVTQDITERKLAENALRESQLKLSSIADNSPDWLILVDADWRIQFANRAINGIAPADMLGMPVADVAPADQIHRLQPFLRRLMEQGQPSEMELVVCEATESQRVLLSRARPVMTDGRIVGAVINCSDITERVRQQRQLRLQAHILETMREGVVLLDADNRVRVTNPSFDAMFGCTVGGLADRPFEELLPAEPKGRGARMIELRRQLERSRHTPLEFECQRPDGSVFAAAGLATRSTIGGVEHLLLVLSDVSERKLLEREILEVSNREQQRIGADLHDGLGQELTGVALMLRGLAADIHRDYPKASLGIDEIVTLVNHAIQVTRTLAHGLSPVSIERGGLLPALRTLAARASEAFGISVTLRTRLAIEPRLDEGAANHLHRIVQEALSNALRHGQARTVKIHLSSDEQSVRLSIRDDGRGIRRGDTERSGLGLRTMNYRAQVIGGQLEVFAHQEGGTVVRCVCPQGAHTRPRLSGQPFSRES